MTLTLKIISSITEVNELAWNLCVGGHPFAEHSFLRTLETTGAIGKERGILPMHVLLFNAESSLIACAPGMLKWSTLREHGPEVLWLRSGVMAGCFNWPKMQLGVPLFPISGPRIFTHPRFVSYDFESIILKSLQKIAPTLGAQQSFNIMHVDLSHAKRLAKMGAQISFEKHSYWANKDYQDLAAYLSALQSSKRTSFLRERHEAESHGLTFKKFRGSEITDEIISAYYEGHCRICKRYGNNPWLPLDTYRQLIRSAGDSVYMLTYIRNECDFIAGILGFHSKAERTLYLMQWSEIEKLKSVGFDLICRRPIDFAIENSINIIDSGLAAQHKKLRGWQTVRVFHAHWFNEERLASLAKKTSLQFGASL